MSESIKNLLGISDETDIAKMSGEKIFKTAMKSGKISKKIIIEFDGHNITDDDKRSIACMLIKETDIDTMNEFMNALDKEIKYFSKTSKNKSSKKTMKAKTKSDESKSK